MSRGRRYNNEPKLNIKKVIAVIIAIIVIVMFVIAIKNLINSDTNSNNLISTTYFLLNKDGKWGVIDNNSKIVIEPTYEDSIIIPNNKKDVFICTYDVDYEKNTYKTKVINSKNKELFENYDSVLALTNYDENNNLWYEENVLIVKKDDKYGLIDFKGNNILNIEYDDIYALKGVKNSLITVKEEKLGLVDDSGKKVLNNEYDEILSLGKDCKKYIVKKDGKYGVNDILDCEYEEIKPLNNTNIFCVKENGKLKVIDKDKKEILSEKFDDIETIKNDVIVYKNSGKFYAYNVASEAKVEKGYKELKYTSDNLFIFKAENNYGIINIDNQVMIEDKYPNINFYDDARIYELEDQDLNIILNKELKQIARGIVNEVNSEKLYIKIWEESGYKYYSLNGDEKKSSEILANNNLFLSKKDNKYGFVDKKGNVVVDYIYDDAREQNDFGYIAVKKDGLWGSIKKNGQIIIEPKYNLDENLLIDFIGGYHLGKDLNLMYYTY